MMNRISDDILQEMVKIIVEAIDPEQIILFGSQASGNPRPDSDIDILVVAKPSDELGNRRKIMAHLWHILGRFAVPIDILLYSLDEVEQWRHSINHVIARAIREGVVLYGRS